MKRRHTKHSAGMTLIELMISLAIGSIVILSVFTSFSLQSSMTIKQAGRTLATEEGREIFTVTSALIKQARSPSIKITNSGATISFMLIKDAPIWPNDVFPFSNNWVKLSWVAVSGKPNKIITIAKAATEAALASATEVPLAGDASGENTNVSLMKLTAPATGGVLFQLQVTSGNKYSSKPQTTSFESTILPRN